MPERLQSEVKVGESCWRWNSRPQQVFVYRLIMESIVLTTALFLKAIILALVVVDNRQLHSMLNAVPHAYEVKKYTTIVMIIDELGPVDIDISAVKNQPYVPGFGFGAVQLPSTSYTVGISRGFVFGANPTTCLPRILSEHVPQPAEPATPHANFQLFQDVNDTLYPGNICQILTNIETSYASRYQNNPLLCDESEWSGFNCFVNKNTIINVCPTKEYQCPVTPPRIHNDCCMSIFEHGDFFHIKYNTSYVYLDENNQRFQWNTTKSNVETSYFRIYDDNHIQYYSTPFVVRENMLNYTSANENGSYPIIVRHTTESSSSYCNVEQLYIEKDDNVFSINFDLPDASDPKVELLLYPFMIGGTGLRLECADKLPNAPPPPSNVYNCIVMDPIVTRMALTVEKTTNCKRHSFILSDGLLWGMSNGFRVCTRNRKLVLERGMRCAEGDVYLYRTRTSDSRIVEDNNNAIVTEWAILQTRLGVPGAEHVGLYWNTLTRDFELRPGNYLHTFFVECPYRQKCWEKRKRSMAFSLPNFDYDTEGFIGDNRTSPDYEAYIPQIDWILQQTSPRNYQVTAPTTVFLTQDKDNTLVSSVYKDPVFDVTNTSVYEPGNGYDQFDANNAIFLDKARIVGILNPKPMMYPFLAETLGICEKNLNVETFKNGTNALMYWEKMKEGKQLACPPIPQVLCYQCDLTKKDVKVKTFLKDCKKNETNTFDTLPPHHKDAWKQSEHNEVLVTADIGNADDPYLNMELGYPEIDEFTGCLKYPLNDKEYPLSLKLRFVNEPVSVIVDNQNKTAEIVEKYGEFVFLFEDGSTPKAYPVTNVGRACLKDLDELFGKNTTVTLQIRQDHSFVSSTFDSFEAPKNFSIRYRVQGNLKLYDFKDHSNEAIFQLTPSVSRVGGSPLIVKTHKDDAVCKQWDKFYKQFNPSVNFTKNTKLSTTATFYTKGCSDVCRKLRCLEKSIVKIVYQAKDLWFEGVVGF
jgi:hypothetical protein